MNGYSMQGVDYSKTHGQCLFFRFLCQGKFHDKHRPHSVGAVNFIFWVNLQNQLVCEQATNFRKISLSLNLTLPGIDVTFQAVSVNRGLDLLEDPDVCDLHVSIFCGKIMILCIVKRNITFWVYRPRSVVILALWSACSFSVFWRKNWSSHPEKCIVRMTVTR